MVLLTIIFHLMMVILILVSPKWLPKFLTAVPPPVAVVEQPREQPRFVFVQPRLDLKAPRPPARGEASDIDRMARTRERARNPKNDMPFARGNSPERVGGPAASARAGPRPIRRRAARRRRSQRPESRPKRSSRSFPTTVGIGAAERQQGSSVCLRERPGHRQFPAGSSATRSATCSATFSATRSRTSRAAAAANSVPKFSSTPKASSSARGSGASSRR